LAEPGGICISARVQEDVAGRLDLAFEDMGELALKNITRPVRVYRVRDTGAALKSLSVPALPLPDKPSIAVLPFANMSGDPEQEYFADGMVEEIITALSRIRCFFVIARNSSFTLQGPGCRREAGRARAGGSLCPRRLGAESRRSRAHHRAADRCPDRHASLGRSFRRLARGHLRPSGQGRGQRCRGYRAGVAIGRDASLRCAADRPISALTTSTCAHLRSSIQ
jgi:hypothetical protein